MIRALMLDVDGVLVCGRPEDGQRWDTALEADIGISPVALRDAFFARHWAEIVVGRAGLMERLRGALADIAPALPAERLVEYWFAQDSRVDAAVLEDMATLRARGVAVHLATNQEHLRAAWLRARFAGQVDGVWYSAALGARKPEPAFFARAAAGAGLAPAQVLLVDDTAANVVAARQAGWHGVVWTGAARLLALVDVAGRPEHWAGA